MSDQGKIRRRVWRVLKWCGILGALGATALVIAVVVVTRPAFQRWAWEKVRPVLAERGIAIDCERFAFRLTKGVGIDGLRIALGDGLPARGKVELRHFEVEYSLGHVLSRRVEVNRVDLAGLLVDVDVDVPMGPTEPPPPAAPFDVVAFLRNPPASLALGALTVDDVDIHARVNAGPTRAVIRFDDISARLSAELAPGVVTATWEASVPGQYDVTTGAVEARVTAKGGLRVSSKGALNLRAPKDDKDPLAGLRPWLSDLTAAFALVVERPDVGLPGGQRVRAASIAIEGAARGDAASASMDGAFRAREVAAAPLRRPVSFEQTLRVSEKAPLASVDVLTESLLDGTRLARFHSAITGFMKNLTVRNDATIEVPTRLSTLVPGAEILTKVGPVSVGIEQSIGLEHDGPVWAANFSDPAAIRLDFDMTARVRQGSPAADFPARFADLAMRARGGMRDGVVKADASVTSRGDQLARWLGEVALKPGQVDARGRLETTVGPRLALDVPAAGILGRVGRVRLGLDHRVDTRFTASGGLPDVSATITGDVAIDAGGATEAPLATLDRPVSFRVNADVRSNAAKATLGVDVPVAALPGLARVTGVSVTADAAIPDARTQDVVSAKAHAAVARAEVLMEVPERQAINSLLKDLVVDMGAVVNGKSRVALENLRVSLARTLMVFEGTGRANVAGAADFKGRVVARMPGKVSSALKLVGGFEMPLRATMVPGGLVSVELSPSFDQMGAEYPGIELAGLHGKLNVREDIRLIEGGAVGFQYRETHSPYTRVDYEAIAPYLATRDGFRVGKIRVGDAVVGPARGAVEIRQNLILVDGFRASLLEGDAVGRLYVDLTPAMPTVGILGRFTNLQPRMLLSKKRRDEFDGASVLSGRSALVFDMRKRLMNGRVDITKLGRDQLLALLDVIDPRREDPQIGAARKALYVAAPRRVAVAMTEGMMDLEVVMSSTITQPIQIRSIPLTPLIQAYANEPLSRVERLLAE